MMFKKRFELFIGYFGNGATVCNKAVEKNGEYQRVAHISPAGNIKIYDNHIPTEDMDKIDKVARTQRDVMGKKLDLELSSDYGYCRVLEEICNQTSYSVWEKMFRDISGKDREEKVNIIKDVYLAYL